MIEESRELENPQEYLALTIEEVHELNQEIRKHSDGLTDSAVKEDREKE